MTGRLAEGATTWAMAVGAVRPGDDAGRRRRQHRHGRLDLDRQAARPRSSRRSNPLAGIGRVFSKAQLIDALKACLLALLLGAIGALWLSRHVDAFAGVLAMSLPAAIPAATGAMASGLALILLALAVFAAIDVPLQKYQHAERLKMSHQELKQEHKELEGNAEVKGKVRARMREMTKRRMIAAVPKADLVVMNPTHYAVALKYDDKIDGRAARRRQGRRPAGAAHPRRRRRQQGAGARGAGARACALRPRRARPRDPDARCSPRSPRCSPTSTSCARR